MLNRTTSYPFQAYGDVLYQMPDHVYGTEEGVYPIHNKEFDTSYISTSPVWLETTEGIALIAVSVDGVHYDKFVVHRVIKLKAGVHFNLISISAKARIKFRYSPDTMASHPIEHSVSYDPIVSRLLIREILTSYYQVLNGPYQSGKEKNNFYELVYVDHGEMDIAIEDRHFHMVKDDLVLYHPGQKHSMETPEDGSCSYMTITFTMDDQMPGSLKNRIFHTQKDLYQLLTRFMKTIQQGTPVSQELAILKLKEALIMLYKNDSHQHVEEEQHPVQSHYEDTILNEILVYIHNNIYEHFTVEDLCQKFSISRSSLQALFRTNLELTPKQYISELKLNEAKKLIKEHDKTISQISDALGFTSIHYFSRRFKAYFGISPSDYAKDN